MSVNTMTLDAVLKNFGDRLTIIEERHMSGVFAGNPTIRDQFAMSVADQAFRIFVGYDRDKDSMGTKLVGFDAAAKYCYSFADAMMEAREKK